MVTESAPLSDPKYLLSQLGSGAFANVDAAIKVFNTLVNQLGNDTTKVEFLISRILQPLVLRSNSRREQCFTVEFTKQISTEHCPAAQRGVLKAITAAAQCYECSKSAGKILTYLLKVAAISCLESTECMDGDLDNMIESLGNIFASIAMCNSAKLRRNAVKPLRNLFVKNSALKKKLLAKSTLAELPLLASVADTADELKHCAEIVCDGFGGKTIVSPSALQCCTAVLKSIDHGTFADRLLPAITKSLLRSPESCMASVAVVLQCLDLDLGRYVDDLVKPITAQLSSKVADLRHQAALCCSNLVTQCTEAEAVQTVAKAVVEVLKDKQLSAQRRDIWAALSSLAQSHRVARSAAQDMAIAVLDGLVLGPLPEEAQEAAQLEGVRAVEFWCRKNLRSQLPEKLCGTLKKLVNGGNSKVRAAALQCITAILDGELLACPGAKELRSLCEDVVSKALKQGASAVSVAESIPAALVILRLGSQSSEEPSAIAKQIIATKLYANAGLLAHLDEAGRSAMLLMIELLLTRYVLSVNEDVQSIYHSLTLSLYLHSPHPVRVTATRVIAALLNQLDGVRVANDLLNAFGGVQAEMVAKDDEKQPDGRLRFRLLELVAAVPSVEMGDADTIALKVLKQLSSLRCDSQRTVEYFKPLRVKALRSFVERDRKITWNVILKKLNLDAQEFGKRQEEAICNAVKNETEEESRAALVALLLTSCDSLSLPLLELSLSELRGLAESIASITDQDCEVAKCPADQLWDTSVLDKAEDSDTSHMKRENKAYKFKEQVAELELRKEITEKKRREGKLELTAKQKGARDARMKEEAEIREHVLKTEAQLDCSLAVLRAILASRPATCLDALQRLEDVVLPLCEHALAYRKVAQFWEAMALNAFDEEYRFTAMVLSNTTLRTHGCFGTPNKAWAWEKQSNAKKRVVARLNENITSLGHTAFALGFVLLRKIIADEGTNADLRVDTLQLIDRYIKHLKTADNTNLSDVPIELLCGLLLTAVSCDAAGGQLASSALIDLCRLVNQQPKTESKELQSRVANCLLASLFQPSESVRQTVLQALDALNAHVLHLPSATRLLWLGRHDTCEENAELAEKLWHASGLQASEAILDELLLDIQNENIVLRQIGANALGALAGKYKTKVSHCVNALLEVYDANKYVGPQTDEFGRRVLSNQTDPWHIRAGVAQALTALIPHLPDTLVSTLFDNIVPDTLGDPDPNVQNLFLQVAIAVMANHGKNHVSTLLPRLETLLDSLGEDPTQDRQRQCLVVLLGTLAQHLEQGDPRIRPILGRLVETLSTPSQTVQEAVARCMPPLIPSVKDQASQMCNRLMLLLFEAETYGERRGAAYGLAGLVKGMGILALKDFDVMSQLVSNVQDKKNPKHREGSLFAFEMLSEMLGKMFEPYMVHIMQHLLYSLGDSDKNVRQAAEDCAKTVMKHLSSHGVKMVLPALLQAIQNDSWRTKAGSVELLGTMAYCAPKQLSTSLPSIVPQLVEVLTDSHVKVREAGELALKQIAKVIRNPEVQALSTQLLGALADPAKKTNPCLLALQRTSFSHFIDAPSLALVMPVIQRAFQDRASDGRKMAADIFGHIYSLADQKDVEPYLSSVMPGLQAGLMDPAPEVRAVSARALANVVRGLGPEGYTNLRPWLAEQMRSTNSVDRSGAAQGLSEILGHFGNTYLENEMESAIAGTSAETTQSYERDGYLLMYVYLPDVFGQTFAQYLPRVLPGILKALADETEYVRASALRAGECTIKKYCDTALPLLLPQLELGTLDDDWRIRQASVELIGDLLFELTGVTGKSSAECSEDDSFGTERSNKTIIDVLGVPRRNRVFARLCMARSDTSLPVRQTASHIWKLVVANTPRTIREILPMLFQLLLGCLASPSNEQQQIAARCLGELVRKLGDRIVVEVIPILEEGLRSSEPEQRQGVCVALGEIMTNTTKDMIVMYSTQLMPTIRMALVDPLPAVRSASARTFDVLYGMVGAQALDTIVTPLLEQLDDPKHGDHAMDGIRAILSLRGRQILPHLIPKLTTEPINGHALARLTAVCGDSLTPHLEKILPALLTSLAKNPDPEHLDAALEVLLSIQDPRGISVLLDLLLPRQDGTCSGSPVAVAQLLAAYLENTKADLTTHFPSLITACLRFYTLSNPIVIEQAAKAFNALVNSHIDAKDRPGQVFNVRRGLSDLDGAKDVPGFANSDCLKPLLNLLRDGLLQGGPDIKEQAADCIGNVVKMSDPVSLKPFVVNLTGPLIRVLGDRHPPPTKQAILNTLADLLDKVALTMKPFVPQLQSTFLKALNDTSSRGVRLGGAAALARLAMVHSKLDTLVLDLCTQTKTLTENAIRETMLLCLRRIAATLGAKMSASSRAAIQALTLARSVVDSADEDCRRSAGAVLGALCTQLEEGEEIVDEILKEGTGGWEEAHTRAVALLTALCANPGLVAGSNPDRVERRITALLASDRIPVACTATRCATAFLLHQSAMSPALLEKLARMLNHQAVDVKRTAGECIQHLDKCDVEQLKIVIPTLVNGTKEKNAAVKSRCEEALVLLLRLHVDKQFFDKFVSKLDSGMRDSLTDVYASTLVKAAKKFDGIAVTPIDDTFSV